MNRDAIEPLSGETSQEAAQLPRVSDRAHAANGQAGEGVEHAPVAGADRESAAAEMWFESRQDARDEPFPASLEVEHELCLGGRGAEQFRQLESRQPRRHDLPAIPEDGQRAHRLQMADFEPPVVEPDVGFDERGADSLSCPQVDEPIACAVRDEERVLPAYEKARRGHVTHSQRV